MVTDTQPTGSKIIIADITKEKKKKMNVRNIALTLEKAREWYNSGSADLKEVALQAYSEEELKIPHFQTITRFGDAVAALGLHTDVVIETLKSIEKTSKASAAMYRLNIIRKALNMGHKMEFTKGTIWYPYTPALLPRNSYCKDSWECEVAKVKVGCDTFTLLGGGADDGAFAGLGGFGSDGGVAVSGAGVGFLGCATKEIAQHFGKYFAKEIFEAKYGDLVEYEWV